MKFRIYILTALLLGLMACGGKQAVSETAVSASSEQDASAGFVQDVPQAESSIEADVAEVDIVETAVTSSNSMDSGSMAGNTANETAAQTEEVINQSINNDDDAGDDDAELSDEARQAIQLVAEIPEVATWLATYPDWTGDAWQDEEDGRIYSVDFYSDAADEWLGWGTVNVADSVVEDYFVPRELTAEEFQAGLARVEQFVFNDEEVMARLGDSANWEHDTWYDRWDAKWEVWFWYGLDEMAVTVNIWEDDIYLDRIYDPTEMEADQAIENSKNEAIGLAWGAEGIDQALADVDNWQTYVSQQSDAIWAVSFVGDGEELFYVLVDIENEQILESD